VIIDDDDAGRALLRRVLERRGFEVHDANNGRAGVELIWNLRPAAALVDLRMPGELSGLDVISELRNNPETAALPILIVSASAHADARELASAAGATGFVEKPIDFQTLYDALDSALATTGR
jgi:CheY-like chemotaxis protein